MPSSMQRCATAMAAEGLAYGLDGYSQWTGCTDAGAARRVRQRGGREAVHWANS